MLLPRLWSVVYLGTTSTCVNSNYVLKYLLKYLIGTYHHMCMCIISRDGSVEVFTEYIGPEQT